MINPKLVSDEISIALLEQGIGSFDVLQESLASVVLCRLDEQVNLEFLSKVIGIWFAEF
jgi:hypothetical protein